MMILNILIAFTLLISSSYANTLAFDYCVGDPTLPHGPSGYSCKDPRRVTTNDFAYSGLRTPSNTSNALKYGVSYAIDKQFPALTGMGISMARNDIDVGGVVPLHSHRTAELAILIKGTIVAGFIDTNNKPFYKTLNEGDIFVFPPALEHFQFNVGNVPVVAYAAFPSSNPGFQGISSALFKNNLPTDIIQKISLLDVAQIKKLKAVFGGTN
ncbi:hypothetical protein RND81_11G105700 [Saponaria officinalis]|uniref:Germin-like protein n=1 Tax=Saponaria officinalis TaxID=3572 RepID=A0AAW1HKD4_SAPOF